MEAHILNGDSLAHEFSIPGEIIVARECLIEGPVNTNSIDTFWSIRATYLSNSYRENELQYFRDVKAEFEKLRSLKSVSAINLWFEHDLFCQVNMWFVINYLSENKIDLPLHRVMPPSDMQNIWSGFGRMKKTDLENCYRSRIKFSTIDVQLGLDLWDAYRKENLQTLKDLSSKSSSCYPKLKDAVEAHIQRFPSHSGRPKNRLREILRSGKTDFSEIFSEFSKTEGVYGFGDAQIRNMLLELD